MTKLKRAMASILAAACLAVSLSGCGSQSAAQPTQAQPTPEPTQVQPTPAPQVTGGALVIAKQGMFSSGGTVTEPVEGEYDSTTNWLELERHGNTAHVGHANVFYQIPQNETGLPMVYLHGYGQSRMGWMTTPDGREGWSDLFLKKGHSAFLVDQPGRGEAGAATEMTTDGMLDAWAADSKEYKPGDQAWYTHFRIGRVAPDRYEGSQFPEGEEAQNQFFRQMTPNTTTFDMAACAQALGEVMADVKEMTGEKSIFVTHSQGGAVGWDVPVENIAAIVAIEPGGTPSPVRSSISVCWRPRCPSWSTLATTSTTAPKILCQPVSGRGSGTALWPSRSSTTPTAATPRWWICPRSALPETATSCSRS